MSKIAILADDITGAGDSGVHFAQAGKRTAMLLERAALAETFCDHEAVALSSESRFLSPERAAEAVRQAAGECRRLGARIVFKKVDSTLRGNPGAEIEAILDASEYDAALVCVAMPKTGRTCRDGVLLLHGKPVRETDSGRDPFNPLASSRVAEILAAQTDMRIANIHLDVVRAGGDVLREKVTGALVAGARVLIADAETDADLAVVGQLLRGTEGYGDGVRGPRLLPVGAGGLAEAFTGGVLPYDGTAPHGRMLAVVGSLTGVSLAQIRCASERGDFHVLELDMAKALQNPAGETARLVAGLASSEGRHLLLKNLAPPQLGEGGCISTEEGVRAAEIFGEAARAVCLAGDCSVLYVTGGSTAVAAAAALGLRSITLERECMPGVVLSSCVLPGMQLRWFISKAGGFGGPDTIVRLASGIAR